MRKLVIFGDSTTQEYSEKSYPQQGWVYGVRDAFKEDIEVLNVAHGGYSLKMFQYSGEYSKGTVKCNEPQKSEWYQIKELLNRGDFMIFYSAGINDKLQTGLDAYREQENGDYVRDWQNRKRESYIHIGKGLGTHGFFTVTASLEEYVEIFCQMVNEVKKLGVIPILVRGTGKYYKVHNDDRNVISVVREYSRAVEDVAKRTNSLYLDVGSEFEREFGESGYDKMMARYFLSSPDFDDNVHYNMEGAKKIADLFIEKLKETDSELKQYLKENHDVVKAVEEKRLS